MGKKLKNKCRKFQKTHKKFAHRRPVGNSSTNDPNNRQNSMAKVNLREDQVGVTEYVSKCEGFEGILKSRFSDFHVNEIDVNGQVLHLTDTSVPQPKDNTLSAEELAAAREEIDSVINQEIWEKIDELAAAKTKGQEDHEATVQIDVTELDKERRTQIHKMLKKLYDGKLVSTTLSNEQQDDDGNTKKFIKIMKSKGGRDRSRNSWSFPGEYVHFLVHKENLDTSEVAACMANRLNLHPSQVNYCGTKDKRAKTTQKFCIKHRTPAQIVGSVKGLPGVRVGNFQFSNQVIKLGDLKGNRFRIALRHLKGEREKIEQALIKMREHGFINYFGLQRFGNCATVPTYEVGVALLKSDYKLACELILKPRDNDLHFMRAIREIWWKDRNSSAAAAMFHSDKYIEKKLLDGLTKYGENDYAAALRKIPRNMLLLYPHAFQSLIFNNIASRRIKEFGLKLMPGDLVYRDKNELDSDIMEELPGGEDGADGDGDGETSIADKHTSKESIFKRKVKPLTPEEIASGNYTPFDIVLPLPGYDITYPDNDVATWYEEALQQHGLSSEKLRHSVKTYALAGAYRKLLIQPTEMSWEFCNYDNVNSTLIASDWEQLQGQIPDEDKANTVGKFSALLLDFCLPSSTYATMMLRELLKCDTSAANQATLEKRAQEGTIENHTIQIAEKRKTTDTPHENVDGMSATKIPKQN